MKICQSNFNKSGIELSLGWAGSRFVKRSIYVGIDIDVDSRTKYSSCNYY